jgi:anti-sigma regulatory factor (Ser/Thr protein kinase)
MRHDLSTYLSRRAVDATVASQVVLAADEAFINAISHSGSDDMIRVLACVSGSEATVEVRDSGSGFAYRRSRPGPIPDVLRPSGRGVFLIETIMDDVSVVSGKCGTTVRMVRRLA